MITFLPDESFVKSMECLDSTRLCEQRVRACRILEVLTGQQLLTTSIQSVVPFNRDASMWERHPAIMMWRGYEDCLRLYLDIASGEWQHRGYVETIHIPSYKPSGTGAKRPLWLGYDKFHQSHRSNLIRKDPKHYRKFWPTEPDDIKYFWPSKHGF